MAFPIPIPEIETISTSEMELGIKPIKVVSKLGFSGNGGDRIEVEGKTDLQLILHYSVLGRMSANKKAKFARNKKIRKDSCLESKTRT